MAVQDNLNVNTTTAQSVADGKVMSGRVILVVLALSSSLCTVMASLFPKAMCLVMVRMFSFTVIEKHTTSGYNYLRKQIKE